VESWLKDIDRARSEAEVVRHARDFCSLLHPRDLEPLARNYREVRVESDADIAVTREKLARGYAELHAHASEVEKLRDLMTLLARAADRLAELRGAPR
jgi:hypothetical protein